MKGVILAAGTGSRLYPASLAVSKHLLPVYDKPLIYYPLSTLLLCGIRDIAIVTTPRDAPLFASLLENGSRFGISLTYLVQEAPRGIAHGLLLAKDFAATSRLALILGDNIFYGHDLPQRLKKGLELEGASIFTYPVQDPERYGVVSFDASGMPSDIVEKPLSPLSRLAVTGLYGYGPEVFEIAASLAPSARGESEITDVNRVFLRQGRLNAVPLGRGHAWLDAGNPESLLEASFFIETLERRQGLKISCPEEIAYRQGWIGRDDLCREGRRLKQSGYGAYLLQVAEEGT